MLPFMRVLLSQKIKELIISCVVKGVVDITVYGGKKFIDWLGRPKNGNKQRARRKSTEKAVV